MILNAYLTQQNVPEALRQVIETTTSACIDIAYTVAKGALAGIHGVADNINVQGEDQKKLDVLSNDILKQALTDINTVRAIASEEEATEVEGSPHGEYVVAFDPLDGSSNIDINGQIGTIFTILPVSNESSSLESHFLQPGRNQVCAGYVLYGASTVLMLCVNGAVSAFTLCPDTKAFIQTEDNLSVPEQTTDFSVNMANKRFWSVGFNSYIDQLLKGEVGERGKRFNMRWNGAMVGDVHRVLSQGGIFMYPSDTKNPKQPAKLRLLYEANPMALIATCANALASSETENILDIMPDELHQRVPVILGSKQEVEHCLSLINGHFEQPPDKLSAQI